MLPTSTWKTNPIWIYLVGILSPEIPTKTDFAVLQKSERSLAHVRDTTSLLKCVLKPAECCSWSWEQQGMKVRQRYLSLQDLHLRCVKWEWECLAGRLPNQIRPPPRKGVYSVLARTTVPISAILCSTSPLRGGRKQEAGIDNDEVRLCLAKPDLFQRLESR